MEQVEYEVYVGVDWATQKHAVCATNAKREVLGEREFEHSGAGLAQMCDWLLAFGSGEAARIAVSIEVPRGPIVETLLERGFHVYALNPKQLDRFRDRHSVAGSKNDALDAFVLADALRTDRPLFRQLVVDASLVIQVREASRAGDDLREEANRLTNRLRELLHRFFPQLLLLVPAADEPWLWALLELAPTPDLARKLNRTAIGNVLREHRIRRLTADEVLAALREPDIHVAAGVNEAAAAHCALLIPRLRLVAEQRRQIERQLDALLDAMAKAPGPENAEGQKREHRDVEVLRSLPGIGRTVAATMFAEASQPLADRDYSALRGLSGTAPVTRQSGKKRSVSMRRGCNTRLRNAMYHWARVATQHDPLTRDLYAAMRKRGHTHGRAIRGVADRLLAMLVAMLKTVTTYDPARRGLPPAAAVGA
jgi:transposase